MMCTPFLDLGVPYLSLAGTISSCYCLVSVSDVVQGSQLLHVNFPLIIVYEQNH